MVISAVLFLTILYNLVLIGIILRNTHPQQPGRNFIWFLATISAWILGEAIIDFPWVSLKTVLWTAKAMHIAAGAGAISWACFCYGLTGGTRRIRTVIWVLVSLGVPWLFLVWGDLLITGATTRPWGDNLIVGPFTPIYALWLVSACLLGFSLLVQAWRRVHGHVRMQIRYIMWGSAAIWGFAIITCLVVPLLDSNMGYSKLGPLSSLVTTSSTTYAIVRYRLMDIRIVLRTSLTYILTAVLLGCVALIIFAMTGLFAQAAPSVTSRLAHLALFLLAVMTVLPLWNIIRGFVDRLIFPSELNYDRIINKASSAFVSCLDTERIIATLEQACHSTINQVGMAVYLNTSTDSTQEKSFLFGNPFTSIDEILNLPMLKAYMLEHDEVLISEEMMRQPAGDRKMGSYLSAIGIAAICPMIAHGHLCGLLLLGEKSSGDIYTERDILLLHSLAKHAALAIENASLFEVTQENNLVLERRVMERTEELSIANARLIELDQSKDRFLAYLSHEMLTPLTCILGWSDLALANPNDKMMLQALDVIRRNAHRQESIVDELLEVSRIVHHKLTLEIQEIDLREIILHAYDTIRQRLTEREITITHQIPDEPCLLMGDGLRLQQVVDNILNNALKFTDPGGKIFLTLTKHNDGVELRIHDTGRGVAAELLPNIFQPFIQSERDERFGGLGLGLALVKGIIELHGGQVRAESTVGQGFTAIINLPLQTLAPDEAPQKFLVC
ncbi:MAG TPA: ATP-binding protein [Armatimonadota bacterium]|nr:ATP-binding protein [Armatimonadota bacterium]